MARNRKRTNKRIRLSRSFYRDQFACECGCGFDTVDANLIIILQMITDKLGRRIDINCGCRCPKHNSEVGGKGASTHMLGKAADIIAPAMPENNLKEMTNVELAKVLDSMFGDLLYYYMINNSNRAVHVDTGNI